MSTERTVHAWNWLKQIQSQIVSTFGVGREAAVDPSSSLAQIANSLLLVCSVAPTTFLDDKDESSSDLKNYPGGKLDHCLPLILCKLRPVALDVACLVCDEIGKAVEGKNDRTSGVTASSSAALVLFGHWLPISPQIAPVVSDLFSDVNPLDEFYSLENLQTRLNIAGGAHRLFHFFCSAEHSTVYRNWLWNLGGLIDTFRKSDGDECEIKFMIRYHAAHAVALYFKLPATERCSFFEKLGLQTDEIPPFSSSSTLPLIYSMNCNPGCMDIEMVRSSLPLHPRLSNPGSGSFIVPKCQQNSSNALPNDSKSELILTSTTSRNLGLLSTALYTTKSSVLVCGPHGSGKSALVRELARVTGHDRGLLELHLDDQTDSKTLLGTYVATDIPGKFEWRPGALTHAVRSGRWVLMEDVDTVPTEVLAALVPLIENGILPLDRDGGKEVAHPDFRFIGTCTTFLQSESFDAPSQRRNRISKGSGNRALLGSKLWQKVHVDPLSYEELKEIGKTLYPTLPMSVVGACLETFRACDVSGRDDSIAYDASNAQMAVETETGLLGSSNHTSTPFSKPINLGRNASVRDYMKLCRRIGANLIFEPGTSFLTESQRTLCLAEAVDVFASAAPSQEIRSLFVTKIAAPIWGVTSDLARRYVETRKPSLDYRESVVDIGRVKVRRNASTGTMKRKSKKSNYTETSHSLRLMESISVCISQNEAVLLVGETGCGKTALVQRLASLVDQEIIVQNMSLQTDSSDLLGGYRPLEMKHIARPLYLSFVELFTSKFSRQKNASFLNYVNSAFEKQQWKKLSQCLRKGAKMGINKEKGTKDLPSQSSWVSFLASTERFEKQRLASETGLAFAFTEGALVGAIREGKWILLDEINLASSETLQRLCGLLDDSHGSIVITERGDSEAVVRHPNFRLFAAMNPATDAGKKDLPLSMRTRFTELYVDELVDPVELRMIAANYLSDVVSAKGSSSLEHSDLVMSSVEVYLKCRDLAEQILVDGGGQKPRYTLRTLCRALVAAKNLIIDQHFSPQRAVLEGFELAFEGPLDEASRTSLQTLLRTSLGRGLSKKELQHPARRPGDECNYVLLKPFWVQLGPRDNEDWSDKCAETGITKYVLTPSVSANLRCLSRAIASGPWNILLEGPTSSGKTTMVEFLAARCGHRCVRINNHEHTDIQEYTGCYTSDSNGTLSFQDGVLVESLRQGHWLILDELNLAPSEVLEALNRLLDDNRELYIPETNEVVKPHPNFRLFATQNPCGAYGGRKPLSRAFRNRFVELHVGDIPSGEMVDILEMRCGCPRSHAKLLVKTMSVLRQRRSKSGLFRGKDGLITPRDLLRWAQRSSSSKTDLAIEGYMLLAERLRDESEKVLVQQVIEEQFGVRVDVDEIYYGTNSKSARELQSLNQQDPALSTAAGLSLRQIAPTKAMLRLLYLVQRCVQQKEPVLLVGETGCGKTTVVQLLNILLKKDLQIINCHASTETSDILGGLRPLRGRNNILLDVMTESKALVKMCIGNIDIKPPPFLLMDRDGDVEMSEPDNNLQSQKLPSDALDVLLRFAKGVGKLYKNQKDKNNIEDDDLKTGPKSKRQKLEHPVFDSCLAEDIELIVQNIEKLCQRSKALFEWQDGPLVAAMRNGHLLLLDEMSLAEDAVLERLNSVLEPARLLVLAEKGGSSTGDSSENEVRGHKDFRIFATMNPGGDFGKRELSPALRSRFTEIWVPAVTDRNDIDIVLKLTLLEGARKCNFSEISIEKLRVSMLDYVDWFNNNICGDSASNVWTDYVLSLRDILGWVNFIIDFCKKTESLDVWMAFLHGAALMHLDGLGLGTGLSGDDADKTRKTSKQFLLEQVPIEMRDASIIGFVDEVCDIEKAYISTDSSFGVKPFVVQTGNEIIPNNLKFNMTAPTTGMNLRRVLRAMQLSKPVLLEGSPGVGKTSLISALAAASGHRLVRINLSEQTDISDLMGSDLPVPDNGSGADSGSRFKWCDGVFLKALKRGDWVLLDELNLASQSVLEGLNSCFDHRAQIFIPELGQIFNCPPSFRVFAAQNPLAQGGGRKGLPKSFLNRFTKVFVEALTSEDLKNIVCSRFPFIDFEIVDKMVKFTSSLQDAVMIHRTFGQAGSPWEFNLRDVFRWCELMVSESRTTFGDAGEFVDAIYIERFRTETDRVMARDLFSSCFGVPVPKVVPMFNVSKEDLTIGNAIVPRQEKPNDTPLQGDEPAFIRTLLRPFETIGRCMRLNWPCLLVGPSSSGKSNMIRLLCEATNNQLEEVALTPSSDVSELLGCFEQIDQLEMETKLTQHLHELYDGSCVELCGGDDEIDVLKKINQRFDIFAKRIRHGNNNTGSPFGHDEDFILNVVELLGNFETAISLSHSFCRGFQSRVEAASSVISQIREINRSNTTKSEGGHFRWVDGLLVKAMLKGKWLHLENVNFCSSSVLDRLNPLMESDGELVLTECGAFEGDETSDTGSRVIVPHPNFRLILSMNSISGDVSRAMRNRCIEVCLMDNVETGNVIDTRGNETFATVSTMDALDALHEVGIKSASVAYFMLETHYHECRHSAEMGGEQPNIHDLKQWGRVTCSLIARGFQYARALQSGYQLAYGAHETSTIDALHEKIRCAFDANKPCALMPPVSFRKMWLLNPLHAKIAEDLRIISHLLDGNFLQRNQNFFPLGLNFIHNDLANSASPEFSHRLSKYCLSAVKSVANLPLLLNCLLARFASKATNYDISQRVDFFKNSDFEGPLKIMLEYLENSTRSLNEGTEVDIAPLARLVSSRLVQVAEEAITYEHIQKRQAQELLNIYELSVMEVSFLLSNGLIERGSVKCPVTPTIFLLFEALDSVVWARWRASRPFSNLALTSIEHLLITRDRFWRCMSTSPFLKSSSAAFFSFDESGFFVNWRWFNKALQSFFNTCIEPILEGSDNEFLTLRNTLRKLDLIVGAITDALREITGATGVYSDTLWKKAGHPLVPILAKHSSTILNLKRIADSSYVDFEGYSSEIARESLDLEHLVDSKHPHLFVDTKLKVEVLAALCMAQWAATDELRGYENSEMDSVRTKAYDMMKVENMLSENASLAKEKFALNIKMATLDEEIVTIENQFSVEDMEKLRPASVNAVDLVKGLLNKWADVQTSQLIEFWCTCEEIYLIQEICAMLLNLKHGSQEVSNTDLNKLVTRTKYFIELAVTQTLWSPSMLRPYQTFAWAVEGGNIPHENLLHLLKCILPLMINFASHHTWCNSFDDIECLSLSLISPSFWKRDADDTQQFMPANIKTFVKAGPLKFKQPVQLQILLRLFSTTHTTVPRLTLENSEVRAKQACTVISQLARHCTMLQGSGRQHDSTPVLLYQFVNIIEALSQEFRSPDTARNLILLVLFPENCESSVSFESEIKLLLNDCTNACFNNVIEILVLPLLNILCPSLSSRLTKWSKEQDYILAWVYLGLLQLNLLLPSAPLDPARKPAAKVTQWEEYLKNLGSQLVAFRWDTRQACGDDASTDPTALDLLDKAERASAKKLVQGKKVVERPSNSPPFIQLFRDLHSFAKTTANISKVLDLAMSLGEASSDDVTFSKEMNWQDTTCAFLSRVSKHYSVYEDVTIPYINAVRNIQWGLRELAAEKKARSNCRSNDDASTLRNLLSFPIDSCFGDCMGANSLCSALSLSERNERDNKVHEKKNTVLFASIARLEMFVRYKGKFDKQSRLLAQDFFNFIVESWRRNEHDTDALKQVPENGEDIFREKIDGNKQEESEEEAELRLLREQFPDHASEFNKIIEEAEDPHTNENDTPDNERIKSNDSMVATVTPEQLRYMCNVHKIIFDEDIQKVDDACRMRSFIWAYDAAAEFIKDTEWTECIPQDMTTCIGAQMMGIAVNTGCSRGIVHKRAHASVYAIDFHHEPNPMEVRKAEACLSDLLIRVNQLLRAFPGHAVLVAIAQVSERVRQLDISTVSLGKVLSGLEVILRKAQEWEQHSSERVTLGHPLKDMSKLVAQWRKLELSSWKPLLDFCERRQQERVQRHWMRIHTLLFGNSNFKDDGLIESNDHRLLGRSPSWVWKGLGDASSQNVKNSNWKTDSDDYVLKLVKLFDTFLLVCSIGEFSKRLEYVYSFANQILSEFKETEMRTISPRWKLGRILYSMWTYYSKFVDIVENAKASQREPIEKRLSDEVRIAKWDEQSYYSLAESTEKSHQKLMTILKKYEEVLLMRVSKVLESDFLHGVRSSSDSPDTQPVTTIPGKEMLFPRLKVYEKENDQLLKAEVKSTMHLQNDRKWATVSEDYPVSDAAKHVRNMKKYSKKMQKIIQEAEIVPSWAKAGSAEATNMCDAIFERIDTLRQKSGTKPVKQRALVDLFKIMKKHGFSSMKWSVPPEIRQMSNILQLPCSRKLFQGSIQSELPSFDSAENYFQRSNVELSRLRNEVAMFGSQYMSRREMELMVGLSENGLFLLCQQRCMIDNVAASMRETESLLRALDFDGDCSFPSHQRKMRELASSFFDARNTAVESLRQLSLLLRTCAPSIDSSKREFIRDASFIVDDCADRTEAIKSRIAESKQQLLSEDLLHCAFKAKEDIGQIVNDLIACAEKCANNNALPRSVFDSSLMHLRSAAIAASACDPNEEIATMVEASHSPCLQGFLESLSSAVESSLLGVQELSKHSREVKNDIEEEDMSDNTFVPLWESHKRMALEWASINIDRRNEALRCLIQQVEDVSERNDLSSNDLRQCAGLSADAASISIQLFNSIRTRLHETISLYRSSAKLTYVLLRVFRVLVSKGFCADDVEDREGDGEGDVSGMKFEDDVEGTGMGEGDGKNDVSDQIENEEQLLGLKDDEPQTEDAQDKDSRELEEEEAEKGMEMEGNFDGDMYDMPDKENNEEDADPEGEEELDREMGDGDDQKDDVVDEKIWDSDEDEDTNNDQQEEKFEKDSKMNSSEPIEDEMMTKEEDEQGQSKEESNEPPAAAPQENKDSPEAEENDAEAENTEEQPFNEDTEDKYEENAGVDVRGEEENEDDGDDMELDDDLNLDGGGEDEDENENDDGVEGGDLQEENEEMSGEGDETFESLAEGMDEEEQEEDPGSDVEDQAINPSSAGEAQPDNEEEENDETAGMEEDPAAAEENEAAQPDSKDAHGVASQSGKSNINQLDDDNDDQEANDDGPGEGEEEEANNQNDENAAENPSNGAGISDDSGNGNLNEGSTEQESKMEAPNPFRNPGDAEKFWHEKLNIADESAKEETDVCEQDQEEADGSDNKNPNGTFEFTNGQQGSTTQVLGDVAEEDAAKLEKNVEENEDNQEDDTDTTNDTEGEEQQDREKKSKAEKVEEKRSNKDSKKKEKDNSDFHSEKDLEIVEDDGDVSMSPADDDDDECEKDDDMSDSDIQKNKVVTDLGQLKFDDDAETPKVNTDSDMLLQPRDRASGSEIADCRKQWMDISAKNNHLSRRLCEKLRLVMEPLVATKLQGDYRTGKRINMKRVISYVASGFRKDKIWLRRTKPAKRNYRVLLAVDNSESMRKSGAGEIALCALATLANGMSQLEIGDLGVASFGEEMKLLHNFQRPWTSESGTSLVSNLKFDEKRTKTASCVESALSAMENASGNCSQQLMFIISDGRIERDNRSALRRLVREMTERNVLLVMMIVEGGKKKESIVNMKEVSFQNGKPKVKYFIEDYPFPYYMVLDDMSTLPEVLGDALRQWFEMLAQLQNSGLGR